MKTSVLALLSLLCTLQIAVPVIAAQQPPLAVLLTEGSRSPLNQRLAEAVVKNNLVLVRALLQQGASPNTQLESYSGSLLHLAAEQGRTELVRALLDKGANALMRNATFEMPSELARAKGHTALAELLRSAEEGRYTVPKSDKKIAVPSAEQVRRKAEEARRKLKDYNYVKENFGRR